MSDTFRENPFRLAFGLMRLPKLPDGSIDVPQVCEMADRFIAAGGTYFDTAFVYDGGESEKAFKAAVADRYPREAVPFLHSFAARYDTIPFPPLANQIRSFYWILSVFRI